MAWEGVEDDGHDCDPSVAVEGRVLMTPGGRSPHTDVGQGPCAPEVERRVPPIASSPVEVGGEAR